jgi:hypothetical protein
MTQRVVRRLCFLVFCKLFVNVCAAQQPIWQSKEFNIYGTVSFSSIGSPPARFLQLNWYPIIKVLQMRS